MTAQDRTAYLDRAVGDVVAEDYARAAVFTRLGIDFCCGGRRTVAEAGARAGISDEEMVDALAAADRDASEGGSDDPRSWRLDRLTAHIEDRHHQYVRRTLPVLGQWLEKLVRVHGGAHPELLEIRDMVGELSAEMEEHMAAEETRLFPAVVRLESAAAEGAGGIPAGVLDELEEDHERAGGLMSSIRRTSNDFHPPAEACSTWRATFALLQEFESDLHRHVHLENNILFPRALERSAAG